MGMVGNILSKVGRYLANRDRFERSDYYESTVRPADVSNQGRYVQLPYREMVQRYSGYVRVAASRNAAAVASLPIRVYRKVPRGGRVLFDGAKVGGERRARMLRTACPFVKRALEDTDGVYEVTDDRHPIVALLQKMNPRDSQFEVMESVQTWSELTGNGYLAAVRGPNGWPIELWPLASQYVRALPCRERFIRGYVYGTSPDIETIPPIDEKDVVHARFPNPLGDPYYGMGPLSACVVQADLANAISQFQLGSIENNAQPGLVVTMPGATEAQRKEAQRELDRQLRGPAKASRSLVIGGTEKTNVEMWKLNEKELSYLQGFRDVRELIANVFDMPVSLLTMESAALATAEKALEHWHEMSIRPRKQRLGDKLNEKLIPMFGSLGDGYFLEFDDPVSEPGPEAKAAAVAVYQGGVTTLNEARALIGLPPTKDGGDDFKKVVDPFTFNLAEKAAFDKERKKDDVRSGREGVGEGTDVPGKEAATGDDPAVGVVSETKRSTLPTCGAGADSVCVIRTGDVVHRACSHQHPEQLTSSLSPLEENMRDAMVRWFGAVLPGEIIDAVRAKGEAVEIDLTKYLDELADALLPKQQAAFVMGWNDEAALADRVSSLSDRAAAFLAERRKNLVASLNETVNKAVSDALITGVQNGLTGTQLIEDVQGAMGGVVAYSAERVALTETSKAMNGGREEAWKEIGVEQKEWLLSGDPCQFCAAMAGRIVDVGKPFVPMGGVVYGTNGGVYHCDYEAVHHPPLRPGCRCGLGMVEDFETVKVTKGADDDK